MSQLPDLSYQSLKEPYFLDLDCQPDEDYLTKRENLTSATSFLDDLLGEYDKRLTPTFHEENVPTVVIIDVFVSNIDCVEESTMDFGVTIFLRQMWTDPRLVHSPNRRIPTSSSLLERIWKPDLFFTNEKEGNRHDLTVDNTLLRIRHSGEVFVSQRLSLMLNCQMALHRFPMDHQVCMVQMESFGYTNNQLIFKWRYDVDPVQLNPELTLPHFTMYGKETGRCDKLYWTGNFTCISVSFSFTRQLGFYVMSTYGPTFALVVLSWISFWMSADAAPARISLGITVILTTTTQAIGQRENFAKVSYITAIDIWMSTCFIFVMGAIVEFSIVNFLHHLSARHSNTQRSISLKGKKKTTKDGVANSDNDTSSFGFPVRHRLGTPTKYQDVPLEDVVSNAALSRRYYNMSTRIDNVSKIVFPCSFLLFNVCYWSIYLTSYKSSKYVGN
ncbi:glycine receptor subunit alpha-2-like [Glandiceps talaboti]